MPCQTNAAATSSDVSGGGSPPSISTTAIVRVADAAVVNNNGVSKGEAETVTTTADEQARKQPKRKVAIIFGYVGERYCGLQWNHLPDYPTVEEELLRALYRTNMISQENYEQEKVQQKLNWDRASRTDKGVHALRNVISLNVMLPYAKGSTTEYDTQEARRLLMTVLPPDIVVYEIVPVTRSFNAYMLCGARTYEYYLPTFALMSPGEYSREYFPAAFAPSRPTLEEVGLPGVSSARPRAAGGETPTCASLGSKRPREVEGKKGGEEDLAGGNRAVASTKGAGGMSEGEEGEDEVEKRDQQQFVTGDNGNDTVQKFHDGLFEKLLVFHTIPEDGMRHVSQYRLSHERLEHARSIFRLYEGTYSYHNFTPGGRASDPASMRYITSVTVGDPFIIQPTDAAVASALQQWTPSRCYSPDGEELATQGEKDEAGVEKMREQMREHMLRVYGGSSCEGTESGAPGGLEVVRIELHGQSFMLNQIRKMIGGVVSICATGLPPEYLREHLLNKAVRCGVPMVPANGLFLSYLDFRRYNYRLERIQSQGGNGSGKGGVYVDRVNNDAVEEFRRKIIAVVLRNEMVGDLMGRWMRSLRHVLRLACGIELP
ncbi:tRNA pseudouridine38-40 synthase [Trypanosoma rangeli]|uniref:tRNA pseudouridine38-40 synthase n=1 Tax=Trypanosoma rangeli TaxID=5698 RepID=A0A422N797_TRYRA|nr:tRNA pseudouridine38-40 synthase [Trypanosoma rangeli]RNF01343.1 tRNA pseudouridine38-40 synthase [Trypanosoma rangeli]|eukprot:RNF01343.1 tRNA pseudouridine38-40 synthase [Trypanosoma rangeli]